MIQNSITLKKQKFRNSIRREQIQTYKRNKRKYIQESNIIKENSNNINNHHLNSFLQNSQYEANYNRQNYNSIINHHQLNNLLQMPYQILKDHMQMLNQIILDPKPPFKPSMEQLHTILEVIIDYYEAQEKLIIAGIQNLPYLASNEIEQDTKRQITQAYVLTKMFKYISINDFTKMLLGIYYKINPSTNILYVKKTLRIIKNLMEFSFKDSQTTRHLLSSNFEEILDYSVNKFIFKSRLFLAMMNMTDTDEDQQIVSILKSQNIFEILANNIELYGLRAESLVYVAAIYANSIDYLCDSLNDFPACHEFEEGDLIDRQNLRNYYLYLPIFQNLINVEDAQVMANLTYIASVLLKCASKNNLSCKQYLISKIQDLIRMIIYTQTYLQGCTLLFVTSAHHFNVTSALWLTDYLDLTFKNLVSEYQQIEILQEERQNKIRRNIRKNINKLLDCCEMLLGKRDQDINLDYQKYFVDKIFQFWCNEDIFMGYKSFFSFMLAAVQQNQELTEYVVLIKYRQEFIHFLLVDCITIEEIHLYLKIINSLCDWLNSRQNSLKKEYLRGQIQPLARILQKVDGYHFRFCSGEDDNNCEKTYQKISQVLAQYHDYQGQHFQPA